MVKAIDMIPVFDELDKKYDSTKEIAPFASIADKDWGKVEIDGQEVESVSKSWRKVIFKVKTPDLKIRRKMDKHSGGLVMVPGAEMPIKDWNWDSLAHYAAEDLIEGWNVQDKEGKPVKYNSIWMYEQFTHSPFLITTFINKYLDLMEKITPKKPEGEDKNENFTKD